VWGWGRKFSNRQVQAYKGGCKPPTKQDFVFADLHPGQTGWFLINDVDSGLKVIGVDFSPSKDSRQEQA
jgi:hypothetical protein